MIPGPIPADRRTARRAQAGNLEIERETGSASAAGDVRERSQASRADGRSAFAVMLTTGARQFPAGSSRSSRPAAGDRVRCQRPAQLADWLTREQNPLTSRVAVNRVWQHLFGQGLVGTPDDFGTRGERPSNPELLDYLARQFMREGWSVKRLIRGLVLSRSYQLSSKFDRAAAAQDPENRWLWRMSRRRLDAEVLRDAVLSISGQLDPSPARIRCCRPCGPGHGRGGQTK